MMDKMGLWGMITAIEIAFEKQSENSPTYPKLQIFTNATCRRNTMKRIKEQRKQLGLTQKQLSQQLGIANSTLSTWERGDAAPDYSNLNKLASIFGVSVDYLVGSRNDPLQSRREIVTQEKAAYALLLEDNPVIARGGEVGSIVYGHEFQVYILSLLDVMLRDDEKSSVLLRMLSKIVESVSDPRLEKVQIDSLLTAIDFVCAATKSDDTEAHEATLNIVKNHFEKHSGIRGDDEDE